jgi:glycosyltransferase involved in cell wall biosynthesis
MRLPTQRLATAVFPRKCIVPKQTFVVPPATAAGQPTGAPVLASRLGSLPEVIGERMNGLQFESHHVTNFAGQVRNFREDSALQVSLRHGPRECLEAEDTPQRSLRRSPRIYSAVRTDSAHR